MSVGKMCKALKISNNSYYNWTKNRREPWLKYKAELILKIKEIHKTSRYTYGSPRITIELQKMGYKTSKSLVAKLMKQNNIKSILRKKYVVTTNSKHNYKLAENILDRNFKQNELGKVWVSDITYIKVKNDWNYLTTVIDLADRKVIGWSISEDMSAKNTVIAAYNNAKINRMINPEGMIFHSDRGSQYACNEFKNILKYNKKTVQSMSRKGNCWDNAVAESFFKTIKSEMTNHRKFNSTQELKLAVFEYIEHWYNRCRLHSALDYKTPIEKENELLNKYKNVA